MAGSGLKWLMVPLAMLMGWFIINAEPAVHVLNQQVEEVTDGMVTHRQMLIALSLGVGLSIGLSILRLLMGFSLLYYLIPGYLLSLGLSFFKIVEGILADKIPLQIMTPVVLFIGAAGYLSLMANNTGLLFFGALGYGCAASSCTVLYPVILRRLYGKRLGTAVWGICWAAFMLGHAIWTPLIAKTYDVTGSYNVALISSAIIFVVAGIFLFIQISTKGMVEKD